MKEQRSLFIALVYISFSIIISFYLFFHLTLTNHSFELLLVWKSIVDINIFGFSLIFLEIIIGVGGFIIWLILSFLNKSRMNRKYKNRLFNILNNFFSLRSSSEFSIFDISSYKLKISFYSYGIFAIFLNFIYIFLIPNPYIPGEILTLIKNFILFFYLFFIILIIINAYWEEERYNKTLLIIGFFILMFVCTIINFIIQLGKIFYYVTNIPFIDFLFGLFSFLIGRKIFQKYYEKYYKLKNFTKNYRSQLPLVFFISLLTFSLTLIPIITLEIYFFMHLIIYVNAFRLVIKSLKEEGNLFQTYNLKEFMEIFLNFINNYYNENTDQSILNKIHDKLYLIWDANRLKISHFNKLGIYLSNIETIFGEYTLNILIEKKRSEIKEFLLEKQSFNIVKDFIIQAIFFKTDIFRIVFNENERRQFFTNTWIPTVNRKIDDYGEGLPRAQALHTLARGYDRQYGKVKSEEVIKLYKEAFEIYKKYDLLHAAEVRIDLGNFLRRTLKKYTEAKENIEEAKILLESIKKNTRDYDIIYAGCLNVLGLIHYGLRTENSLVIGRTLCEESQKIKAKWGDADGVAESENAIGLILIEQGKITNNINLIKKAIEHFKSALKYREKAGNFRGCGQQLRNLGLAYENLIKFLPEEKEIYFQSAKESFEKGLEYWYKFKPEGPPLEEVLEFRYRMGELDVKYGDKKEGFELLIQVENELNEINDWNKRARSLDLLREAYKGIIEKEEAINHKIISLYKNVLNDENMINEMKDAKIKFKNAKEILERIKLSIKRMEYPPELAESYAKEIDELLRRLTLSIG